MSNERGRIFQMDVACKLEILTEVIPNGDNRMGELSWLVHRAKLNALPYIHCSTKLNKRVWNNVDCLHNGMFVECRNSMVYS